MTEELREAAQYRKGKTPLVGKYLVDHKQLFDEIAGRGFLNLPGYAYDAENQLEIALKLGLSELNYKILAETVERELKQRGIDYNNAYATALMAWEIEKQGLITDWDAELAGIKQGMAEREDDLNRLSVEVDARQAVLIAAKTAIDVEMEGYRKDLAELDAATAPYEVQLANAKLLTAQKKLELLPIIEEIITKEQELITLEQSKSSYYGELIAAEEQVANKKQQLVPGMADLATVTQRHADAIPSQIEVEKDIAEEKIAQATAAIEKEQNKLSELEVDIDTANKEVEIGAAKRTLQTAKFNNEQTLIDTEINNENKYQNEVSASYDRIIDDERATKDEIISDRQEANDIQNDTKADSTRTITDADVSADQSINAAGIYADEQVAEIKAAQKITASLEHLIG